MSERLNVEVVPLTYDLARLVGSVVPRVTSSGWSMPHPSRIQEGHGPASSRHLRHFHAVRLLLTWKQEAEKPQENLKADPSGRLLGGLLGGRGSPSRRYTIGKSASPWTPKAVRDEAERLLTMARQGVDPADEKEERQRIAHDLAFSSYADLFLRQYVKRQWKASYGDAERIFRLHIKPAFKNKPLPLIRKGDIAALYDAIPPHQTALRRKAHAVLSRLFRWALGRGDIERSPLEGAEPPLPPLRAIGG